MTTTRKKNAKAPEAEAQTPEAPEGVIASPEELEPEAETSAPHDKGHVVQAGDTLSGLAKANGLTLQGLMALNGKTSTRLAVGETLRLV